MKDTISRLPQVENSGVISILAALAICLVVFSFISVTQWIDGVFIPIHPEHEITSIPQATHDEVMTPPPPKKEEAKQDADIKPPSIDEMQLILAPLSINWSPYHTGLPVGISANVLTQNISDIVDQSMLDGPPVPTARISPNYHGTTKARVDVIAIVDERGRVVSARVSRYVDSNLDRLAVSAARQWRFQPGTVNGTPTKFKVLIPFIFKGE